MQANAETKTRSEIRMKASELSGFLRNERSDRFEFLTDPTIVLRDRTGWAKDLIKELSEDLNYRTVGFKVDSTISFDAFHYNHYAFDNPKREGARGSLTATLTFNYEPDFSSKEERELWFQKILERISAVAGTERIYVKMISEVEEKGSKKGGMTVFVPATFCEEFGSSQKTEMWQKAWEYTAEKKDKIIAFFRKLGWTANWYNQAVLSYNRLRLSEAKRREEYFSKIEALGIEDLLKGKTFP